MEFRESPRKTTSTNIELTVPRKAIVPKNFLHELETIFNDALCFARTRSKESACPIAVDDKPGDSRALFSVMMYRKNQLEVAFWIALGLTAICSPSRTCGQTANSSPAPSRSPDASLSALGGLPFTSTDSDAAALELKLQQSIPEQNPIVFYGSSSIRLWKSLPEDLAVYKALNCGFGGSRLTDCIRYAKQIVFPTRPSGVIIYAGDNDLAAGTPPEKAFQSFQKLFGILRSYSSSIPMAFVSVKPSPARLCYLDNILKFNQMVKAYLEGQPDSEYIDVCSEMLGPDRKPITSLFGSDRIHLSPAGYSIMRKEIGEFLNDEFPKQKHKTTVAR